MNDNFLERLTNEFNSWFGDTLSNLTGFNEKDNTYSLLLLNHVKDIDETKLKISVVDRNMFWFTTKNIVVSYDSCYTMERTLPDDMDLSSLKATVTDEGLLITAKKKVSE